MTEHSSCFQVLVIYCDEYSYTSFSVGISIHFSGIIFRSTTSGSYSKCIFCFCIFKEIAKLFSGVELTFFIPISSIWVIQFLCIFTNNWYCHLKNIYFGCFNRYIVLFHLSHNLYFPSLVMLHTFSYAYCYLYVFYSRNYLYFLSTFLLDCLYLTVELWEFLYILSIDMIPLSER